MRIALFIHIATAAVALTSGYVALFAPKGGRVHRKAGSVFVVTMLVMAAAGTTIAIVGNIAPAVNVPAGVLTIYLVATAWTTLQLRVPPPVSRSRWIHLGAMVALGVGMTSLGFGIDAVASGGQRNGIPAFPFLLFGIVGLLAFAGDVRVLRAGGVTSRIRIARHLWRMCFALLIAALSFFLGQAQVIPTPLRVPPLLALPILVVVVSLFYWLWRVRRRTSK